MFGCHKATVGHCDPASKHVDIYSKSNLGGTVCINRCPNTIGMKDDQGVWNFFFAVFFAAVFAGAGFLLFKLGQLPQSIGLFDLILVILASFRLTRLFVYDKITEFVRDWFMRKEVFAGDNGEIIIVRQKFVRGPWRTTHELLVCPWCFGIWAALATTFFYYLTPYAWFPILVLAIAGVGSLLQVLSNMIGWRAEALKKKANE